MGYNETKCEKENNCRQLYFDIDMEIHQETRVVTRTMYPDEVEEYENMIEDSNQLSIFDFIT